MLCSVSSHHPIRARGEAMTAPVPVTDERLIALPCLYAESFDVDDRLFGSDLHSVCAELLTARVAIAELRETQSALREAKGALEAGAQALESRFHGDDYDAEVADEALAAALRLLSEASASLAKV